MYYAIVDESDVVISAHRTYEAMKKAFAKCDSGCRVFMTRRRATKGRYVIHSGVIEEYYL